MSDIGPGPEDQSTDTLADHAPEDVGTPPGDDEATRQWAMFIHFSVLAGWVIPLAGIIVPIVLWQIKKDELPGIVPHAHIVMNWIVSCVIYGAICLVLTFVVIGIFGFMALAVVTIIYAIVGGLKANEGEAWPYPGTIVKIFN